MEQLGVTDSLVSVLLIPFAHLETTSVMASSMTQSNHVYVIIRLKMSENMNGLFGSLFCHYGETDDAFLIGGALESNETLMAAAIRHCRRLVGFRLKPSQRLYLTKVLMV